jgi:hypothetical protein
MNLRLDPKYFRTIFFIILYETAPKSDTPEYI